MQYMVMYIYIFTFHLKTVESSDNSGTRISIVVLPVKIMHWNCDLHQSSRSVFVQITSDPKGESSLYPNSSTLSAECLSMNMFMLCIIRTIAYVFHKSSTTY